MAPIYRIYHPGKRKFNPVKNTIKFLSFCQDPHIHKEILSRAPANVIKGICNSTLNCGCGDIKLSGRQKRVLRPHRKFISGLINKEIPLEHKRKILVQHGGGIAAIILPIILSSVLGTLGSALFKK